MEGLVVPLDHATHAALHETLETVPSPSYRLGNLAMQLYRDNPDDHVRSVTNLMRSFDEASRNPRLKRMEYEVGQLIVACLEIQLPFIREGMAPGRFPEQLVLPIS